MLNNWHQLGSSESIGWVSNPSSAQSNWLTSDYGNQVAYILPWITVSDFNKSSAYALLDTIQSRLDEAMSLLSQRAAEERDGVYAEIRINWMSDSSVEILMTGIQSRLDEAMSGLSQRAAEERERVYRADRIIEYIRSLSKDQGIDMTPESLNNRLSIDEGRIQIQRLDIEDPYCFYVSAYNDSDELSIRAFTSAWDPIVITMKMEIDFVPNLKVARVNWIKAECCFEKSENMHPGDGNWGDSGRHSYESVKVTLKPRT